jgi:hypothetical protein
VELQRSTPTGEEKQDVTLVMSAERGILAITGRPGQVRNIDFIPWDQIRQLRRLQLTSERISLTKQFLKFLR